MSAACPPGDNARCHWDCGTIRPACHRPATWVLISACIHEHVISGGMCDRHKARMDADPGPWVCMTCERPPGAHRCVASLVWRQVVAA